MIYLKLFVIVQSLLTASDSARILAVFPVPSISHQVVFRPLVHELAHRGHEVVVITTDPAFEKGKTPPNLTEIDVHDLSYDTWRRKSKEFAEEDFYSQIKLTLLLFDLIFEKQLLSDEVKKLMKSEQEFDLLMVEACARSSIAMSHRYKVPMIQISSIGSLTDSDSIMGYPSHPLLYPYPMAKKINDRSFFDTISELFMYFRYSYLFSSIVNEENKMIQRNFGPNAPTMDELRNNIDMLFINAHSIWESNRPIPPSVINIGGIHKQSEKELPKDLRSYLDSSNNGVIFVSFGTNVDPSTMPSHKIDILVKVFSQLPYDVLWKWPLDDLPGRSENIKIGKWFPQSDLLRHKNVKLFITQGGLQSTDEAIEAGVPLIGIPMLAEQWFNVEQYVKHGIGMRIDFETISNEKLKNCIDVVLRDDRYRKNIYNFKKIINDVPRTPLENAVWWTEYVLRHKGAKHLRSPAANMSLFEYYELKLIFFLLFVAFLFLITIKKILKIMFKQQGKIKKE